MDLIEQLGGYERAKAFLNATSYTMDELIMMQRSGLRSQHVEKALLEYRRQHNIFESDDLVTSKKWVDGSIHKIELVDSEDRTLKIFSHDMAFSYWVDSRNYRHATDGEIKAGKRLEVKSEN
ncbi:hypothetical protein [Acinetobacter radioresistens]|uniref:hypothetical protein n=1 Tax=Acinetobacter radioresistens TaxID=40216 RepID=UPI002002E7BE|nr:hypothetical protein [Acinetobacter radioresistens]MCK4077543.1 hypothetical protein [Acinetobacter radioresistens]